MQHYTRNTVSVSAYCSKCGKSTPHRVDGVRRGPCLECIRKLEKPSTDSFSLASSGPAAPCGFPGCVLESFHDGDHDFAKPAPPVNRGYHFRCLICKTPMVAYGERKMYTTDLCESEECLRAWCLISGPLDSPVMCGCPQRPYAHDVAIHAEIRREAFNPKVRCSWPWSLMLSSRVEPSTEKTYV
jgi:hypothetical protein